MTAEENNEELIKKLKCSLCSKQFKYESERKRHEQSHSLHFQCPICSKKFNFISALRRHEKQHARKESVQCNQCSRIFRDEVLLKRHINYAHKGTFICEACNVAFNSKPALQTHMKSHRPESERRYKCSFKGCYKTFNFPHHLKHHELTHTNEKQHFCSVCGKGFIQSHHLKAHLKTHDPDSWFKCEVFNCKKRFVTDSARKRHQEIHSNEPSAINPDSKPKNGVANIKNIKSDSIENPKTKSAPEVFESKSLETTSCADCGDIIFKGYYNEHTVMCKGNKIVYEGTYSDGEAVDCNNADNIRNCKTVLGGCLIESEGGKCLCEQMSKSNDEIDNVEDLTPISNAHDDVMIANCENKVPENICDGCDCSKTCTIKDPTACMQNMNSRNNLLQNSTIKIVNGAIKVVDSCDLIMSDASDRQSKFEIPNSCKDMLGECIVTSDGNEGCLCAQMKFDQIIADEIASITPQPKINM